MCENGDGFYKAPNGAILTPDKRGFSPGECAMRVRELPTYNVL